MHSLFLNQRFAGAVAGRCESGTFSSLRMASCSAAYSAGGRKFSSRVTNSCGNTGPYTSAQPVATVLCSASTALS